MSETTQNTVPKSIFYAVCLLVLVLLFLLLYGSRTPGGPTGDSTELSLAIKKYAPASVGLIDGEGKLVLLTPSGEHIEPCGKMEGTQVPADCDLTGVTITHINTFSVIRYKASDCEAIYDGAGNLLYAYHVDFPGGGKKCHHKETRAAPHDPE